MTELKLAGGLTVVVTHTASGQDDSETLEFWNGPGRSGIDLLAAVTLEGGATGSSLLVHVPNELPWELLAQLVAHANGVFAHGQVDQ